MVRTAIRKYVRLMVDSFWGKIKDHELLHGL